MNLEELRNVIGEIKNSASDAFLNDDTEARREIFNEVEMRTRNRNPDQVAPHDKMFGQHKVATTIRDIFEISDPDHREARAAGGFGVGDNWKQKVGTTMGRAAADVASDNSRNMWWYVNAAQPVTNLATEAVVSRANPDIRGSSYVWDKETGEPIEVGDNLNQTFRNGVTNAEGKKQPGYRTRTVGKGKNAKRYYTQTNTKPLFPTLLTAPAAFSINNSLGLMNPFGGQEGYHAVDPSYEDPTKTANVLSEVAQKYVLGRTGNLLPWSEFQKVRPDVSKDEYMRYKAFKYDKNVDLNPFDDGKATLLGGVAKYTNEGIHGPELQYLGRSIPVTTGAVPLLTTLAGVYAGTQSMGRLPEENVRTQKDLDDFRSKGWRRGLGGGAAGAVVGMVGGNLLEQERRRRNGLENSQSSTIENTELSNL